MIDLDSITPSDLLLLEKLQIIKARISKINAENDTNALTVTRSLSSSTTDTNALNESESLNVQTTHDDVIRLTNLTQNLTLGSGDMNSQSTSTDPTHENTTSKRDQIDSGESSRQTSASPLASSLSSSTSYSQPANQTQQRQQQENDGLSSSGYTYEKFCQDLNVDDDYIVRLLDLLIRETSTGNTAPSRQLPLSPSSIPVESIDPRVAPVRPGNDEDIDDDDYFLHRSPAIIPDYPVYYPGHNLDQALYNSAAAVVDPILTDTSSNYYSHTSHHVNEDADLNYIPLDQPAASPPSVPSSLSSSISDKGVVYATGPVTAFLQQDLGPSPSTTTNNNTTTHSTRPSSRELSSLSSPSSEQQQDNQNSSSNGMNSVRSDSISNISELSGTSPGDLESSNASYTRERSNSNNPWIASTPFERNLIVSRRGSMWDAYDDPSLEGLVVQEFNGVEIPSSWDN